MIGGKGDGDRSIPVHRLEPQGPGWSDEPAAARPIFDGAEMREAFNKVRLNPYLYAP